MIDLETTGSVPGCGILSIGAAAFHPDGWVSDTLYVIIRRQSCRDYGLFEQQATLDWWARQPEEARVILELATETDVGLDLPAALDELNSFVRRQGPSVEVYGNGSDFDNAILAAAANAAHVELAWSFWSNRCYRTLKARAPFVRLVRDGTHHNALDDAISQAKHLGAINRSMALDSAKVVAAQRFIGWMADVYQLRTARRVFGFRINTMSRRTALDCARGTFDANALEMPFGHPDFDWSAAGALDMVDEDMRHWDAA